MNRALTKDHYNDDNLLTHVECTDAVTGEHLFDAEWDPRDKHTLENIKEFRQFVTNMLRRKGYEAK